MGIFMGLIGIINCIAILIIPGIKSFKLLNKLVKP